MTEETKEKSQEFKPFGIKLGLVLAEAFGKALDRLTLWARITTAIKTSAAKVSDGEIELFLSLCLDHVKAETAEIACNENWKAVLKELTDKGESWNRQFIKYLESRCFVVVTLAREEWQILHPTKPGKDNIYND